MDDQKPLNTAGPQKYFAQGAPKNISEQQCELWIKKMPKYISRAQKMHQILICEIFPVSKV